VEWREKKKGIVVAPEEEDLGKGNLFATGLVAGGALAGVVVAFLAAFESTNAGLQKVNAEHGIVNAIGADGYKWLGVLFFGIMAFTLYRVAIGKRS
jgi:hypothetical protein